MWSPNRAEYTPFTHTHTCSEWSTGRWCLVLARRQTSSPHVTQQARRDVEFPTPRLFNGLLAYPGTASCGGFRYSRRDRKSAAWRAERVKFRGRSSPCAARHLPQRAAAPARSRCRHPHRAADRAPLRASPPWAATSIAPRPASPFSLSVCRGISQARVPGFVSLGRSYPANVIRSVPPKRRSTVLHCAAQQSLESQVADQVI